MPHTQEAQIQGASKSLRLGYSSQSNPTVAVSLKKQKINPEDWLPLQSKFGMENLEGSWRALGGKGKHAKDECSSFCPSAVPALTRLDYSQKVLPIHGMGLPMSVKAIRTVLQVSLEIQVILICGTLTLKPAAIQRPHKVKT